MKHIVMILFTISVVLLMQGQSFASYEPIPEEPKITEPQENDPEMDCTKKIPLTVYQKKRLDQIYHRIYMDYVDLIETYAWAGALTSEQKRVRYEMLKNYMKTFQKRQYQWCSEHESDEWEEEWYNSDND